MSHPEPPVAGNEVETLLGSLERQRATFAWKVDGLERAALTKRLEPSAMTLGGLLKHLALVEDHTFARKFLGRDLGPPWKDVDWDADPDWEWRSAAEDDPQDLHALWRQAVQRSRDVVADALTRDGLDERGWAAGPDGEHVSLRRLLIDLVEEYARHVGHADLIRESIDGVVGEDPPDDFEPPV